MTDYRRLKMPKAVANKNQNQKVLKKRIEKDEEGPDPRRVLMQILAKGTDFDIDDEEDYEMMSSWPEMREFEKDRCIQERAKKKKSLSTGQASKIKKRSLPPISLNIRLNNGLKYTRRDYVILPQNAVPVIVCTHKL